MRIDTFLQLIVTTAVLALGGCLHPQNPSGAAVVDDCTPEQDANCGQAEYLSGIWRQGRLASDQPKIEGESFEVDVEAALYTESALLTDAFARLNHSDPERSEVYFLGIAGDGTERVFTREVSAMRNHFDALHSLEGRNISLLNDRTAIGEQPMATRTSIARSIMALASKMDLDQDILVLYVSSHGSESHQILLRNPAIGIADLSAQDLSAMLESSGIKWQAIFVSACFSGGFIEPLRRDTRLIMTAAAADKASFGCSDDAELTYFGRALLAAFEEPGDIQSAFQRTTQIITERESEEGVEASEPQLFIGREMASKLEEEPGVLLKP
ncbi:MAG: C13 family peptidase [Pseudomonadota bacterium]